MNTWIAQFASSTAPRPDLITSTAPLTPEGAAEQLAGDDPPGVSDVRTPHVRAQKAIQGNTHGPLNQRRTCSGAVTDSPAAVYCAGGGIGRRSPPACCSALARASQRGGRWRRLVRRRE